jgi:protocatechuate 3,4-dioxygenase beta subunit
MKRKDFLVHSFGFLGLGTILFGASKYKESDTAKRMGYSTHGCPVTPTEEEGPFPHPGGEKTNPFFRSDIREGQTGIPLFFYFTVVNTNDNCAVVPGARVDIWHCNKDGYYSGYGRQTGKLGTQNYVGKTWLRGYQNSDPKGLLNFKTIYPGWYHGRATHIHLEVFVNKVLRKQVQLTFPENLSDKIHRTPLYGAHGINPLRNGSDFVFGNSVKDLENETVSISGEEEKGYISNYTIGLDL